jgi:hypothetical protein
VPWQLSGYGRSDWSTKLTRGLSAKAVAGFQSRRALRHDAAPVTPQYAAFSTYKAARSAETRRLLGSYQTEDSWEEEMTRGDLLRESLGYAMIGLKIQLGQRFMPLRLTDEQRAVIATKVVANMSQHGDTWNLDEPLPNFHHGPR